MTTFNIQLLLCRKLKKKISKLSLFALWSATIINPQWLEPPMSWTIIALDKALFFNQKVSIFFLFLDKNICCGYSLEAPRWGASNKYPQHMFLSRNKKTIYLIPTYLDQWTIFYGPKDVQAIEVQLHILYGVRAVSLPCTSCLMTHQSLLVILCDLPEKVR